MFLNIKSVCIDFCLLRTLNLEENMKDADLKLLNAIYQNVKMGIASMEELMEICKSEELKAEMSRQLSDYNVLAKECEMLAKAEGLDIKDNNWFDKTMLYSSIKMKTCFNKSEENIAEMLIVGSTMGVIDVIKMKNKTCCDNNEILEIALKLEDFQERNIQKLKPFLC